MENVSEGMSNLLLLMLQNLQIYSTLEMINLIVAGLSSYNFRNHVASDVGIDQKYLPSENIQAQSSLKKIIEWTVGVACKDNGHHRVQAYPWYDQAGMGGGSPFLRLATLGPGRGLLGSGDGWPTLLGA